MRVIRLVVLAAVAASAAACGGPDDPVAKGQAVFNGFGCVRCHAVGGVGGVYGPDLTLVGFRKSPEWLDLWLKNPHSWRNQTVMPNFNLTPELRASLVAYLAAQQGQAWEQRPWTRVDKPVEKGALIFEKAGCVACHSQGGRGGYPNNNVVGGQVPALTKVYEGYTKEELKNRIANGITSQPKDPSEPPPMLKMPAWKEKLSDEELDAVVEYLFSFKPAGKGGDEW